jgi:hypothetical protein
MDVDGLLEEVSAAVALDDYGDPTFRDGLDALWASGTKEADLEEIGMLALEGQVRMYLANRLRVQDEVLRQIRTELHHQHTPDRR